MSLQKIYLSQSFKAVAAIVLFGMVLVSCNPIFEAGKNQSIVPQENPYDWVGRMHNEGMGYNAQEFSVPEVNNAIINIARNNATDIDKRDSLIITY